MRVFSAVTLTAAGMLLASATVSAQSLGEVAAREKEKRKAKTGTTRVITEDDLQRAGKANVNFGGETAAPSETTGTGQAAGGEAKPAEGAKKEKTEEELRAEREQDWRKRRDAANEDLKKWSDEVARNERAAGDVSASLYGGARANLVSRLEDARKQLAATKEKVEALEDERRRNGFR